MTDKQIITKDVDTRGCKFFRHGICASPINSNCKLCVEISEKMCYYKQLKRKEQECEELKKENANLEDIIDGKNGTIGYFKDRLDQYYEIISKIRETTGLKQSMFDGVAVLEELLQKISEVKNERIR